MRRGTSRLVVIWFCRFGGEISRGGELEVDTVPVEELKQVAG